MIDAFEFEKTLVTPLDSKKIKPVNPNGNQFWIVIGKIDAEAEAPILWLPDVKNWLIRKDLGAGKDWSQENGTTEDETVGYHHWLNGPDLEKASGGGKEQGNLACCSPWGCQVLDTTQRLNNNAHGVRISLWISTSFICFC